jgi:hypothetical protein
MANNQQDIERFYSRATTRDFSRDFLFRVKELNIRSLIMNDDDLVYVKAAQLPGRTITNVAVPYMGLNFNVPGGATYPGSDSYALNFYLDAKSRLRTRFEAASRELFDDEDSTGRYGTPNSQNFITLVQLDKKLNELREYKLVGASLRNINAIDYQIASGTGNTVEVGVTLAYHYYEMKGSDSGSGLSEGGI